MEPVEMRCSVGKEIVIELESNGTTGYRWMAEYPDALKVTDEYIMPNVKKGFCGAGGIQRFTVSSETEGTYKLKLDYMRSWEGSEGNVREYLLTFE